MAGKRGRQVDNCTFEAHCMASGLARKKGTRECLYRPEWVRVMRFHNAPRIPCCYMTSGFMIQSQAPGHNTGVSATNLAFLA